MRALVVDDDAIVLECCRRVLQAEGMDVRVVPGADDAVHAMGSDRYDLVLVDVKMPGRDGWALMGDLRERWPSVPIVVMSGFCTTETVEEAYRRGGTKFIAKPFSPDELLEALRDITGKEETDEAAHGARH